MSRKKWKRQHKKAMRDMKTSTDNIITLPNYREVQVHRDTSMAYPELWLQVYIAPDNPLEHVLFRELFVRARCFEAQTPDEADLVVFGGGSDVSPHLYGIEDGDNHPKVQSDIERDNQDITLYVECVSKGIPMFGVCRGAQFLHVMNGGKLFQHVNNHYGQHSMVDVGTGEVIQKISSSHHQMCSTNISGGMQVLGHSHGVSSERWLDEDLVHKDAYNNDIEAFWYPETGCLGVQGHPEYRGYHEYAVWCLNQINDKFVVSHRFDTKRDKKLRMREDLLNNRDKDISERVLKELM
jgi:gamma-glutamyl-gamma-aminobutyrate hydrolase PuuD